MARRPAAPATKLAVAIQARRGGARLRDVGVELGVADSTLSRIERGATAPSAETARALARWLNWTIEQVLEAAETPAPTGSNPPATT